jgi:two-component system cell cycle sensor histidine kinase/response regulator CckA
LEAQERTVRTEDAAELAQTLFEEIRDAVFVVDPQTMGLIDVNPMAERLTTLSRDKLLPLSIHYLFRSNEDESLVYLKRALLTTQTFHSQEGYHLRRGQNDSWIPVNLTLTRLHTEQQPLGLVLARDISERIHAEQQLRLANVELERRVQERTAALAQLNEKLQEEIVEHKLASEALRESEERFRAFMDHNPASASM